MRNRALFLSGALLVWSALPAAASMGGSPKPDAPPYSASDPDMARAEPRVEAERLYADAYDEIAKAKKDLTDGKTKNADKKFSRALDRGQRAVELDPKYAEAWNLVGYAARKLRQYDRALAAYGKCLALKPDYTPAREYLGEAYVELGDIVKAREQLAWLEKFVPGSADARDLGKAIAGYEAAHPAPPAEASPPAAAPADSSAGDHGGR
jgi:tetratricopeptide (TPR) repeat protein